MRKVVYFIIFFLAIWGTHAKENTTLDREKWQDLTEDVDYIEESRDAGISWPNVNFNIDSKLVKYILFLLIIGLLVYVLVRYIISLQQAGRMNNDQVRVQVANLNEAEENPMQADLEWLIEKLLREEDFRGATRAYFLLVLQRLNNSGRIEWKKPKTNFDYVHEVEKEPFFADFKRVTFLFEEVWYGQKVQNAERFAQTSDSFQHLLKQLRHE